MAKRKKQELTDEERQKSFDELNESLNQIDNETEHGGERFYARKFKKLYSGIRKALVEISKKRSVIGSEKAYELAVDYIESAIEE